MLKILFLHGYRQNSLYFKEIVNESFENIFDLVLIESYFCDAPHSLLPFVEPTGETVKFTENEKGWWLSGLDTTYRDQGLNDSDSGLTQSLMYLDSVFESEGPFDGIFAFSQGASLATMLSKMSVDRNNLYKFIRFKFAILVSAFKSEKSAHSSYFDSENKIDMMSLHLIGKSDDIISCEKSINLTEHFLNPKVRVHDLGHIIPSDVETKKILKDFINKIKD